MTGRAESASTTNTNTTTPDYEALVTDALPALGDASRKAAQSAFATLKATLTAPNRLLGTGKFRRTSEHLAALDQAWVAAVYFGIHATGSFGEAVAPDNRANSEDIATDLRAPRREAARLRVVCIEATADDWGIEFYRDLRAHGIRLPLQPSKAVLEQLRYLADAQSLESFIEDFGAFRDEQEEDEEEDTEGEDESDSNTEKIVTLSELKAYRATWSEQTLGATEAEKEKRRTKKSRYNAVHTKPVQRTKRAKKPMPKQPPARKTTRGSRRGTPEQARRHPAARSTRASSLAVSQYTSPAQSVLGSVQKQKPQYQQSQLGQEDETDKTGQQDEFDEFGLQDEFTQQDDPQFPDHVQETPPFPLSTRNLNMAQDMRSSPPTPLSLSRNPIASPMAAAQEIEAFDNTVYEAVFTALGPVMQGLEKVEKDVQQAKEKAAGLEADLVDLRQHVDGLKTRLNTLRLKTTEVADFRQRLLGDNPDPEMLRIFNLRTDESELQTVTARLEAQIEDGERCQRRLGDAEADLQVAERELEGAKQAFGERERQWQRFRDLIGRVGGKDSEGGDVRIAGSREANASQRLYSYTAFSAALNECDEI